MVSTVSDSQWGALLGWGCWGYRGVDEWMGEWAKGRMTHNWGALVPQCNGLGGVVGVTGSFACEEIEPP